MYKTMLAYVKTVLEANDGNDSNYPFRVRMDHIRRVTQWAARLFDENGFDAEADKDAALTAAVFHDAGYNRDNRHNGKGHAEVSAGIFLQYAAENGIANDRAAFIADVIRCHSNKALLEAADTPTELILLMEADLLDETGALGIVWDCMTEGAQAEQSFAKTAAHIERYSAGILSYDPMRTAAGKAHWEEKQRLVREFMARLAVDLEPDKGELGL